MLNDGAAFVTNSGARMAVHRGRRLHGGHGRFMIRSVGCPSEQLFPNSRLRFYFRPCCFQKNYNFERNMLDRNDTDLSVDYTKSVNESKAQRKGN